MQLFIFSNTKHLDFHVLSETSNNEINTYCKDLINDKNLIKLETSPFVLLQRTVEGKNLLCASFNANELYELSSRYFVVDRANGRTPTKCLVVLLLEENENVYLTEELLTQVLRTVYNLKWYESKYTEPLKLRFNAKQEIEGNIEQNKFIKNCCDNILELFYKFNSNVQYNLKIKKPKEVLYYLKEQEKFRLNIKTKFILKGE